MAQDLGNQLAQLQEMKKLLAAMPATINSLGSSFGNQTDSLRELTSSMDEAMDTDKVKDMDAALQEMAGSTDKATNSMGGWGKALGVAVIAGNSMRAGVGDLMNSLKMTWNVVSGLTKGIIGLAQGAIGMLMKSWKALVQMSFKVRQAGQAIAKEFEKIRGSFGSLSSNEGKAVIATFKSIKGAAGFASKAGMSLRRAFGGDVAGLAELNEIAKGFGASLNQMMGPMQELGAELLIMNKGLDISAEGLKNLIQHGRAAGQTMEETLNKQMVLTVGMSKKFGISAKVIGKNLDELAKDFSTFGHMSQKELAATATYAGKLGLSIKAIGDQFDKFGNFEDAAVGAAKLAETFGMNVDALDLMNKAGTPEGIDLLRESFAETGKSLADMTTAEKKYLEELSGLSGSDLYNAFDPANAGISWDEMIDGAGEAAEEMSPEQAMAEAAKGIEKSMDNAMKSSTGFFDSFTQGIMKGLEHSEGMRKFMKIITDAMTKVYHIGVDLGKELGKILDDPKKLEIFGNLLERVVDFFHVFSGAILDLAKGGGLADFFKTMFGEIDGFLNSGQVKGFGKFLFDMIADGIVYIIKELPGLIEMLSKGLADSIPYLFEGKVIEGAKTGFLSIFTEGIKKISEAWEKNKEPILEALEILADTAIIWFEEFQNSAAGKKLAELFGMYMRFVLAKAATTGLFKGLFQGIGLMMPEILKKMKDIITGKEGTGGFFKGTKEFFAKIWKTVGESIGKLKTIVKNVFPTFSKWFTTMKTGLSSAAERLGSFGTKFKGIGAAIIKSPVFKLVGKFFAFIIAAIQSVWNWGKMLIVIWDDVDMSFVEKLGNSFTSLLANAVGFFMYVADGFAKVADLGGQLVGWILGIEVPSISEWIFGPGGVEGLITGLTDTLNYIPELFGNMWDDTVDTFFEFIDAVKYSLGMASDSQVFTDIAMAIIGGLTGGLGSLYDIFVGSFKDAFNGVKKLMNPKNWGKFGEDMVDGFIKGFGGISGAMLGKVKEGWDSFKSFFKMNSPSGLMEDAGMSMTEGLGSGFSPDAAMKVPSQNAIKKLAKGISKLDMSEIDKAYSNISSLEGVSSDIASITENLKEINYGKAPMLDAKMGEAIITDMMTMVGIAVEVSKVAIGNKKTIVEAATVLHKMGKHIVSIADSIQTISDSLVIAQTSMEAIGSLPRLGGEKETSLGVALKIIEPMNRLVSIAGTLARSELTEEAKEVLGRLNPTAKVIDGISSGLNNISEAIVSGGDSLNALNEFEIPKGALLKVGEFITELLKIFGKVDVAQLAATQNALISTGLVFEQSIETLGTMAEVSSLNLKDVTTGLNTLVEEIEMVNNSLSTMGAIEAVAGVSAVAEGLRGDGTVTVQHEGLNIQVNFNVSIDSKDLASALGEGAKDGPFFIINTDRDGGAGSAETPAG